MNIISNSKKQRYCTFNLYVYIIRLIIINLEYYYLYYSMVFYVDILYFL